MRGQQMQGLDMTSLFPVRC